MIKLKSLLFELSFNSTLYHRSFREHKVGDIIDSSNGGSFNKEKKDLFENVLEAYRKEKYPDVISRQDCIFCSVVPRSRFVTKGTLYVVKPVGSKMLMTNSRYIDEMAQYFQRQMSDHNEYFSSSDSKKPLTVEDVKWYLDRGVANDYFEGVKYAGTDEDLEVLCDKVQITEIVNEKNPYFKYGDKVKVTDPIRVTGTVYSVKSQRVADKLKQVLSSKYVDIKDWKQRVASWNPNEIVVDIDGMLKIGAELYIGGGSAKMMDQPGDRRHYNNDRHSRYKFLDLYVDKPSTNRKSIGLIRLHPIDTTPENKLKKV